jgi:excisionase family DNA binding protein
MAFPLLAKTGFRLAIVRTSTHKEAVKMASLLHASEVADRLGLRNSATVHRWARDGLLPVVKLGPRSHRFRVEDVEAFIAKRFEGQRPGDAA